MTIQKLYNEVCKQIVPRLQFDADVVKLRDRVQLKDRRTQIVFKEYILKNYLDW